MRLISESTPGRPAVPSDRSETPWTIGGFGTPAGDQAALVAYRNTAYARLGQLLQELGPAPIGSPSNDAQFIEETGNR